MNKLIVGPLRESAISTVIVIDALDECKDGEPASAILSVLGQFVSQIPKVKFFLTSRPEPRVREGFRLPLLAKMTVVFVLHEVEPSQMDNDIQLFFRHNLLELAGHQGGLGDWPTKEHLDLLCEQAVGLFTYAVAALKFVGHGSSNPRMQLDYLLQSPESGAGERGTSFKGDTTLDQFYLSILQQAFDRNDLEDDPKLCSILGAAILTTTPLSPSTIAILLGINIEVVISLLWLVRPLLVLQGDIDSPVLPFHKSFHDFIIDPTRCTSKRFHISPLDHHPELLVGCLKLMNQTLEKNMCKLPDAVSNSEVEDLEDRTKQYLNPALQYACKSWYKHLIDEDTAHRPVITSALYYLLEKKFLFWLEVLSVLGAVREGIDALGVAVKWLEVCLVFILTVPPRFTKTGSRHHQLLTLSMTVSVS